MSSSPTDFHSATNSPLLNLGRSLFGISILFFGFQYVYYHEYLGGLPPVPPWSPGGAIGAYAVGVILLLCGAGLFVPRFARTCALIIGALFFSCILFLHLQHAQDVIFSGRERTRALEPLSLAAAAFVLASLFRPPVSPKSPVSDNFLRRMGIILFALALPIYGYQHFEYLKFLVTLLPDWIPAHKFLIGFTGTAFIAAGLAILFRVLARTAAIWVGIMLLTFVITLHVPRVAHNLHNADEWSSLFVALAMAGASWIIAEGVKA
jgi:uncharacterized membrane protein